MPGQDFNVTDPIFEWAQRAPYAVAIIDGSEIIHYRTLWAAVRRAMSTFHEAGWQPGDVIAISMRGQFRAADDRFPGAGPCRHRASLAAATRSD